MWMIDNNWSNFQLRRESWIQDCIRFTLIRSVIGLKNLSQFVSESESKVKPITTLSLVFSRAPCSWYFFCFEFFLAPGHISFNAIDHCDYFGFGIRNSIEKCPFACDGQSRTKNLKLQLFSKKKIWIVDGKVTQNRNFWGRRLEAREEGKKGKKWREIDPHYELLRLRRTFSSREEWHEDVGW